MLYHWGTIFNGSLTFHKQDINFIMNYFSKNVQVVNSYFSIQSNNSQA